MTKRRDESKFSKFFDKINDLESLIAGSTLFGILVIVLVQIIGRCIGKPIAWTEEGTRYLFLWMMWVALAAGFSKVESPRVTFFVSIMPKVARMFCKYFYIVVNVLMFGFIVVYGLELLNQQMMMNEMGAAILIPMAFIGVCVPIAGVFGLIGIWQSVLEYKDSIHIKGRDEQ